MTVTARTVAIVWSAVGSLILSTTVLFGGTLSKTLTAKVLTATFLLSAIVTLRTAGTRPDG